MAAFYDTTRLGKPSHHIIQDGRQHEEGHGIGTGRNAQIPSRDTLIGSLGHDGVANVPIVGIDHEVVALARRNEFACLFIGQSGGGEDAEVGLVVVTIPNEEGAEMQVRVVNVANLVHGVKTDTILRFGRRFTGEHGATAVNKVGLVDSQLFLNGKSNLFMWEEGTT